MFKCKTQWAEEENRNTRTTHHTDIDRNMCNKAPAFHWNEFHINWPFHSWIFSIRFLWLFGLMRVQWFVLLSGPPRPPSTMLDYKAKSAIYMVLLLFRIIQIARNRPEASTEEAKKTWLAMDPISFGPALFICFWPFLHCLFWLIFCWFRAPAVLLPMLKWSRKDLAGNSMLPLLNDSN